MQKKITDTTATYGLGYTPQAKLFKVGSGVYVGRRVALMQTSPGEIKLAWSDAPASGWSSLMTVASDAADGTFDAHMTANGDIHVVYGEQSTNYLVTRKLTFANGVWSAGAKVTVYNGAPAFDPSLAIEPGGKLWVSYSRFISPTRWIYVKSSTDGGAVWGSGVSDAGTQISNGSMFAWSRVAVDNNSLHVVYHDQDTALSVRSLPLAGGSWSSQYNIATGSGFSSSFDVGIGADGRMGVAWCRDQLYYREFDGSNWGAIAVVETQPCSCPQMLFESNVPAIVFLSEIGNEARYARHSDRRTGSFGAAKTLDGRSAPFDSVVLYDASSASYEDLAAQAISAAAADVYHSASGCLVKDAGDILYLGMNERFRVARMLLSTIGAGGSVQVSYWNGANWEAFTPANGSVGFGSSVVDILLWGDYSDVPDDWQKRLVNSQSRYWIKIEAISGYTSGPVATQISAGSEIAQMIFRR
ncbi:MAG: hypothetical protein AB1772_05460 [Candidatus Zixiibacteriota bacterium]